jgi:hypothetical protein
MADSKKSKDAPKEPEAAEEKSSHSGKKAQKVRFMLAVGSSTIRRVCAVNCMSSYSVLSDPTVDIPANILTEFISMAVARVALKCFQRRIEQWPVDGATHA